jgi:hypothetical protein
MFLSWSFLTRYFTRHSQVLIIKVPTQSATVKSNSVQTWIFKFCSSFYPSAVGKMLELNTLYSFIEETAKAALFCKIILTNNRVLAWMNLR